MRKNIYIIGPEIAGPISCCQKYDAWLWNTPGQSREQKSMSHIKAHDKVGDRFLFIYRVLVVLICIANASISWHCWLTKKVLVSLAYLSIKHLTLLVYLRNWRSLALTLLHSLELLRHNLLLYTCLCG